MAWLLYSCWANVVVVLRDDLALYFLRFDSIRLQEKWKASVFVPTYSSLLFTSMLH